MKKLFAILLVTVLIGCLPEHSKSNTDNKNILGKPIKIGNIEVAQYDFPKEMNLDDAKEACEALGQGWRLPDYYELELLFQKKDKIGGFANIYYWSSKEHGLKYRRAWLQDFTSGVHHNISKYGTCYVRAVRSL